MPLPPAFLEELRARTPMPALAGRRVRLAKSGRNWKGLCPFHTEKSPSFYVYEDSFHCFGCGAHGDAFAFVMRCEGLGFMEAVERLAGEAGLEIPKPSPEARARAARARDLHGVIEAAGAAYRRRLHAPEGAPGLAYLRRRGLTDETIERFGLGWSGAGRGALAAELRAEGITPAQLLEAGLTQAREDGGQNDLFFNRVIFPIRDRRGRTISFGGRILGEGQPKYVNGPETPVFSKRRSLYGLDLAREAVFRGASLLVVEGYMDVIALHQAGFTGAVAPLGTALTPEQLEALWQVSPEPVLCFDGDAAGARAAARAAEAALPLLNPGRSLRFATLPEGEDPDTLLAKRGPRALEATLAAARPLAEALFALLAGGALPEAPEARAALRHRLTEAAASIPDRPLAAEYRRALLDRFFALSRRPMGGGFARPTPRHPRPVPDAAGVGAERARIFLATCLHHPELLRDTEELLATLDLPAGPPLQVRDALLAWIPAAERLDSGELLAHLADGPAAAAMRVILAAPGLPAGARPGAQPGEAAEVFWQFFGFLRGEAELAADLRAAAEAFAASNEPRDQSRLIMLREALAARQRGDVEDTLAGG